MTATKRTPPADRRCTPSGYHRDRYRPIRLNARSFLARLSGWLDIAKMDGSGNSNRGPCRFPGPCTRRRSLSSFSGVRMTAMRPMVGHLYDNPATEPGRPPGNRSTIRRCTQSIRARTASSLTALAPAHPTRDALHNRHTGGRIGVPIGARMVTLVSRVLDASTRRSPTLAIYAGFHYRQFKRGGRIWDGKIASTRSNEP